MDAPMPLEAPVTIATLFCSLLMGRDLLLSACDAPALRSDTLHGGNRDGRPVLPRLRRPGTGRARLERLPGRARWRACARNDTAIRRRPGRADRPRARRRRARRGVLADHA